MVDITSYHSHPHKTLIQHTTGVLHKVRSLTDLKMAEIAAVFHDFGKLNPNFQLKIKGEDTVGYSNHSYLSAISFLCFCATNSESILSELGNKENLAGALAIIAHHHGGLPDFPQILKPEEVEKLLAFLNQNPPFPVSEFLNELKPHKTFTIVENSDIEFLCNNCQLQLTRAISNPVSFFLETRFSFSCLINSDKSDASDYVSRRHELDNFCSIYGEKLSTFFQNLPNITDLDKMRTQMRVESQTKLSDLLDSGQRLFSLTAPTGAGKTLMLLTLAGEIIKKKGSTRIIYALPFLSITEQTHSICQQVFKGVEHFVHRIDSKADNPVFEKLQAQAEKEPSSLRDFLAERFAEDSFDYPMIITTFVRFFETLLSNKNTTLLKLPNFSGCIFLIDEIQSIPPRLYGFFVALLDSFCYRFNSFAVLSTATMPDFSLPCNSKHNLNELFYGYRPPTELLPLEYFDHPLFDRYCVMKITEPIDIEELANHILMEHDSILVILNTIADSTELFNLLVKQKDKDIHLLNTHFTPNDRQEKIRICKTCLDSNSRVILISTQLIEAGVDIDFPVVYRDISPLPSIVQSAGRCNRNNKYPKKGRVVIFDLRRDSRSRAALIYKGLDERFLNFSRERLREDEYQEPWLLKIQKSFFEEVQTETLFGYHKGHHFIDGEIDFIRRIKEAAFNEIGKFTLIDEQNFGEEVRYYVSTNYKDKGFPKLEQLWSGLISIPIGDYDRRKLMQSKLDLHLRKMSGKIVQIRLRKDDVKPIPTGDACCGILPLDSNDYDKTIGVHLDSRNQII